MEAPTEAPTDEPTDEHSNEPSEAPAETPLVCEDQMLTIKGREDGCKDWIGVRNTRRRCKKRLLDGTDRLKLRGNGERIKNICLQTCGEMGIGKCKDWIGVRNTRRRCKKRLL